MVEREDIYETNHVFWEELLGAELISAFTQGEKVRLYFRTVDGRIVRVKIWRDWPSMLEKDVIKGGGQCGKF